MDSPKAAIEVRRNEDGSLDEVVASDAFVHLEQMSDKSWWLGVQKDGYRQVVWFGIEKGKLVARSECDDRPDLRNSGDA